MTGQALAELCGTLVPGGRACCTYDNSVGVGAVVTLDGYVVGPAGVGRTVPFADGFTQYTLATASTCKVNADVEHWRLAIQAGCTRADNIFQTTVDKTTPYNGYLVRNWTTVTYSLTLPKPGSPSTYAPCFETQGNVAHSPALTPTPPIPPPAVYCPIDDLLPKPADACSVELEATFGLVRATGSACPSSPVISDPLGEPCLRSKLAAQGVAYAGPTSTYRTLGYQHHLMDLWGKYQQHNLPMTAAVYQACTARRDIVMAEQNGPPAPGHRLGYEPQGRSHVGNAFDINGVTVDALEQAVTNVQAHLDQSSPGDAACNLEWGGGYKNPDKFHFVTKQP